MNCPKCGSPVGKNDEYCGSCGYHLNTSGEEKPKKKKSGLMIFTIFLEVIAIVVIVGAIFFVVHGDKETKKDGGIQTEADLNSSEKKEKTDSSSNEGEDGKSDSSSNAVEQEGSDGTSDTENHAEPAPDGTANQDAGAEVEKITSAELLEDSDLLKSVKKTYTRIGSGAITKADASSVIDQDLVGNEPIKAFDDNDSTDWQEGVDGPGIGEYLEFAFDKSYPVAYMTFKLGNWLPDKSDKYYWGNCRPKTLQIDSGNNSWNLTFPDGKEEFLVRLDPETDISNIKITIQDVYTDRIEWKDTAITDIGLWYKED
ncbi:NADase-type glycan-binding domain-containing protein [Blautia sp.]